MTFESMESEIQDLSFRSAVLRRDSRSGRHWDSTVMRTPDGSFTNLALIFSDQCPWSCEIRVDGDAEYVATGSVLEQIHVVGQQVATIRRRLSERAGTGVTKIQGLAFSEVLLNAICHRSYCDPSPIVVDVDLGCTTVTSPGGMMRLGVSYRERTRNPHLTEILVSMGYKNTAIRGMAGVRRAYRSC